MVSMDLDRLWKTFGHLLIYLGLLTRNPNLAAFQFHLFSPEPSLGRGLTARLQTGAGLTYLNLSHALPGNPSGLDLDTAMAALLECQPIMLTHLDLSHNGLGKGPGPAMSQLLRSSESLTALDLGDMLDAGPEQLIDVLEVLSGGADDKPPTQVSVVGGKAWGAAAA